MPQQKIYNPDTNSTAVFDDSGFLGHEPGNTSGAGPQDRGNVVTRGPGNTTHIDIPNLMGGVAKDLIPFGVNMATEGMAGPASKLLAPMAALSPIKMLLGKLGLSTVLGTGVDQAASAASGAERPVLDSGVQSLMNALGGIGLPEALNVGVRPNNSTLSSTTTRQPTVSERTLSGERTGTSSSVGLSKTQSESLGFQPFDEVTITRDPDTGKFVAPYQAKVPREGEQANKSTSTTETSSRGLRSSSSRSEGQAVTTPGQSTTIRDVRAPGTIGHLLELLKNFESFKYSGLQGAGAGNLSPIQSALAGLGFNIANDINNSRKKK